MGLGQVIRRPDRLPLGTAEEVKARLGEVFPGMKYVRVDGPPTLPFPRWSWWRFVLWLNQPRYPYWSAHYEGDQFIAEFEFDASVAVKEISVTLYGRGVTGVSPHFTILSQRTGWQVE